jgi:hypothetical protein
LAYRTIPDWVCGALAAVGLASRVTVGLGAVAVSAVTAAAVFCRSYIRSRAGRPGRRRYQVALGRYARTVCSGRLSPADGHGVRRRLHRHLVSRASAGATSAALPAGNVSSPASLDRRAMAMASQELSALWRGGRVGGFWALLSGAGM